MKYFLGLLILFVVACKNKDDDKFPKEWYKVETVINDEDSSGNQSMVLRLYNDSTYTHYATNFYNFGRWKWSEKKSTVLLIPDQGNLGLQKRLLQIKILPEKQLFVQQINKTKYGFEVEKEGKTFFYVKPASVKGDPLSFNNNTWRIKPSTAETPQQIKIRTVQYLHFLQKLYQHAIDAKMEVIPLTWYPTPLQLHFGNGARMAYSTELKDWNACFYNEEQATEGYKIIGRTMRKIAVHKKDTKAERNIDLIEQILKIVE
jgi:hypothetical protein